ncbi:MAG: thiolase domain-containing protein [Candidatus Shapirobacteria bacterium]|jgi:acetyl-CoA C-acetyltransferase
MDYRYMIKSIIMNCQAYVAGIGKTQFGKLNASLPELIYQVMLESLSDAKEDINKIEAIFLGNFGSSVFNNQLHLGAMTASLIPGRHIPIIKCENACASGGTAFYQAVNSLMKFNKVMAIGVEKMNQTSGFVNSKNIAMAGDYYFDYKEGVLFPVAYALMAAEYFKKYNAGVEDLTLVSWKNHRNAKKNYKAHFYRSEVTLEKIERSMVVASPLRLYDCSPISDGAAAVVLSRNKEQSRSVGVAASVLVSGGLSLVDSNDITSIETTRVAARQAYREAGIKAGDINLAQVHDCFTIAEMLAMEDLGFCKAGEAKLMLRNGETEISGRLPINVDGGLKAGGHPLGATGISQVVEIVTQLRGEAGDRQVNKPEIGLTHNIGGTGGTCVVNILRN